MSSGLLDAIDTRSVVICCGPGGVGKTTTAASIGLAAAMAGKRVCVVTIDPARRLADAMHIEPSDEPRLIEGPYRGQLYALMLDAKATFDHLIEENSRDAEQAERIKSNRLYRNLVGALSGTQEYMATEKLYELSNSNDFDLVVVDTPPARFALDFLSAPSRLAGFLDNKVFRLLVSPGRAYMKALSFASQVLLRTIAKIAGSEIVEDTIAFFQAFDGMEEGFKTRAAAVEVLLEGDRSGFVLIAAPKDDVIDQCEEFAQQLAAMHHGIDAIVVNKMVPSFGDSAVSIPDGLGATSPAMADLTSNLVELRAERASQESLLSRLSQVVGQAPMFAVPELDIDVHDLNGLEHVVRYLLASEIR